MSRRGAARHSRTRSGGSAAGAVSWSSIATLYLVPAGCQERSGTSPTTDRRQKTFLRVGEIAVGPSHARAKAK
jgi:hypothetical protein